MGSSEKTVSVTSISVPPARPVWATKPDFAFSRPHFGSIMYGPILLAGELGTVVPGSDRVSDNRGLRKELPAQNIPALVGSLADLDEWIIKDSASPLHFTVKNEGKQKDVSLIPYFRMHHQYHTVYWKIYSPDEYAYRRKALTDVVRPSSRWRAPYW